MYLVAGKYLKGNVDIRVPENTKGTNRGVVWYEDTDRWEEWTETIKKIDPIVDWIQTPQIAVYNSGDQMDWHVDTWPKYRTHIRHLTLACELQSAPGGRLELEGHDFTLQKGQAIIFRPPDRHRAVAPIEGQRISLTIWGMAKNYQRP